MCSSVVVVVSWIRSRTVATRIDTLVKWSSLILLGAGLAVSSAAAQGKGPELPAIRQLGAVSATTTEKFFNVTNIRALPDGRVFVNDPFGRRVLLFDASLGRNHRLHNSHRRGSDSRM